MNNAVLEIHVRSGETYDFIGNEAKKLWKAINSDSAAPIRAMWGAPPHAEIIFMKDAIEHYVWYANGRP